MIEISRELEKPLTLSCNHVILDQRLQSKLNPTLFNGRPATPDCEQFYSINGCTSGLVNTGETGRISIVNKDPNASEPDKKVALNGALNAEDIKQNGAPNAEDIKQNVEPTPQDAFDTGLTNNISRQDALIISTNNDKYASTLCCYNDQLLFNSYNERTRGFYLILIPDLKNPNIVETIRWTEPDLLVGRGDNAWIQDITYSSRLDGYLILNRSRLRFLPYNRNQLEEFREFPNQTMKRVTCNDAYIFLLLAAAIPNTDDDEIVMMNYDGEEIVYKTLREILLIGNNNMNDSNFGEITDLAVNSRSQIMLSYRLRHRKQIRVCLFNIVDGGRNWISLKRLSLLDCWDNEISYTPRMEWWEKYRVFIVIEHVTGHMIMIDENGEVKGENNFLSVQNQRESPLNITVSNKDWLCVRYESSINIHSM